MSNLILIEKVSDITPEVCAKYIHLDDPDVDDLIQLGSMLLAAVAFIKKYTGVQDLDADQDFVLCVLILVQDMWDNRTLYVDKGTLNRTVESILDLHSVNLI